jgi:hypothetical protein
VIAAILPYTLLLDAAYELGLHSPVSLLNVNFYVEKGLDA